MKIRIITNGIRTYLAPKYKRLGIGNFEAGPRDKEGIQHIQGIFWVEIINTDSKEGFESFPESWL